MSSLSHEIKSVVQSTVAETIQSFCNDHDTRIETASTDSSQLETGIYYSHEYAGALGKSADPAHQKRLQILRNLGSCYNGYAPTTYFSYRPDPNSLTGIKPFSFYLKKDQLPTVALDSFSQNYSMIGCGEVCQLAQYSAVRRVLGNEKTDRLFAFGLPTALSLGLHDTNPLVRLRRYFLIDHPKEEQIQLGDIVSFQNCRNYSKKHLYNFSQNYNAVCVDPTAGSQRFTSLGLPSTGLTREEFLVQHERDFNAEPIDITALLPPKYHDQFGTASSSQLPFVKEETKVCLLSELDCNKLYQLQEATPAEGLELLISWKKTTYAKR